VNGILFGHHGAILFTRRFRVLLIWQIKDNACCKCKLSNPFLSFLSLFQSCVCSEVARPLIWHDHVLADAEPKVLWHCAQSGHGGLYAKSASE
jgi:hypothetical protein